MKNPLVLLAAAAVILAAVPGCGPRAETREADAQMKAIKAKMKDAKLGEAVTPADAERQFREIERLRAGQKPGTRNKEAEAAEAAVKQQLADLEELSK